MPAPLRRSLSEWALHSSSSLDSRSPPGEGDLFLSTVCRKTIFRRSILSRGHTPYSCGHIRRCTCMYIYICMFFFLTIYLCIVLIHFCIYIYPGTSNGYFFLVVLVFVAVFAANGRNLPQVSWSSKTPEKARQNARKNQQNTRKYAQQ